MTERSCNDKLRSNREKNPLSNFRKCHEQILSSFLIKKFPEAISERKSKGGSNRDVLLLELSITNESMRQFS